MRTLVCRIWLLCSAMVCGVSSPIAAQVTGAQINEALVQSTIVVDGSTGNDANPGTAQGPLKTLTQALQRALVENRANRGVKVVVQPGIYRETVDVGQETDAPIVIEAQPHTAFILGSEAWSDWTPSDTPGIVTHLWPYQFGLADVPGDWAADPVAAPAFNEIVRRREMVIIDNIALRQVLLRNDLKAGTFYMDDHGAQIYVYPPPGHELQGSRAAEIPVRQTALRLWQKRNIVLRGLSFAFVTNPFNTAANNLIDSHDILIEDCEFNTNNWDGLGINNSRNITIRRTTANNNGGGGIPASMGRNFLFESNVTDNNNTRGVLGGYLGWSIAGMKHLFIHHAIYRNHRADDNSTLGLWFDTDNADITVDGGLFQRNAVFGIFLEANQGPILIHNATISDNGQAGLLINNTSHITLDHNRISNNQHSQILAQGTPISGRVITDTETHQLLTLVDENWTLTNNIISATDPSARLITMDLDGPQDYAWGRFRSTFDAISNTYSNPLTLAFVVYGWSASATTVDLTGWRAATGQDSMSIFSTAPVPPAGPPAPPSGLTGTVVAP